MYLSLSPESTKVISTLHTLEFYVLCPDGRRFPVSELCTEYAKKSDGLFMRTFGDRLVIVVEAIYPGGTVYWHQAFYLSTGTSINQFRGRVASNDTRTNTWMPFHGLVVKGGELRKKISVYENRKIVRKNVSPSIEMTSFYFKKLAHLEGTLQFDPKRRPAKDKGWNAPYTGPKVKTAEEKEEADAIYTLSGTYGSFLPEGYYRNMSDKRPTLFDRFEALSYLLASHALGGNAYAEEVSDPEDPPNYYLLPRILEGGFKEVFPDFFRRFEKPSPSQECLVDAAQTVAITKPNVINEFLTHHGAIGRMSLFLSFGESDIPVPGLTVSSVPIQNLGYEMPLEEFDKVLDNYVTYYFFQYKLNKITKDELIRVYQLPMSTILEELNQQVDEIVQYFTPSDPGFVVTLSESVSEKNYRGGRKSRRNRRRHNRKRATRRKT